MAKLKDIFPKWMLKERSYGDLDIGGSAFAHLTEGDATGPNYLHDSIVATERINVLQDGQFTLGLYASGYMWHWLHAGPPVPDATVYELWPDEASGSYPVFSWNEDGSLHWGDGTAAPDTSEVRTSSGNLRLSNASGKWTEITDDDGTTYFAAGSQNGQRLPGFELYDGTFGVDVSLNGANDTLEISNGFGGAASHLVLYSPDGSPKVISVANDGTLAAA